MGRDLVLRALLAGASSTGSIRALFGGCYPIAVALHRRTGLPMAIMFDGWTGMSVHAFVIDNDGNYIDAAGYRTYDELAGVYDAFRPDVVLADMALMTEHSDVVTEADIAKADALLERLPHHPWRRLGPRSARRQIQV